MEKEQILEAIRDLERMEERANNTLYFHSSPGRHLLPISSEYFFELAYFIEECRQFKRRLTYSSDYRQELS
jgi:hypothetical protein